jgi:ABC-type Fe3+ transport system permease subunit
LQKLNRAQEEASLDLGATYWQTFWRITVPNLKLSIIGAALLIFTLSMDEIAVSFFLIGRDNTLPLEIWGRLRRGITPEINAISTIIFLFSLIAIVFWYRLRAGDCGSRRSASNFGPLRKRRPGRCRRRFRPRSRFRVGTGSGPNRAWRGRQGPRCPPFQVFRCTIRRSPVQH